MKKEDVVAGMLAYIAHLREEMEDILAEGREE